MARASRLMSNQHHALKILAVMARALELNTSCQVVQDSRYNRICCVQWKPGRSSDVREQRHDFAREPQRAVCQALVG
jgi:hypothetical protein